jgi:hypothetical protein
MVFVPRSHPSWRHCLAIRAVAGWKAIDRLRAERRFAVLIAGGARGSDTLAA